MINYLFDFRQGYQWDGGVHYFCTVLMAYFHGDLVYTVFPRQFFQQVDVGKAFGQCSFKLTGDGLAARCNRIFQSPAALFVVDAYQREDVMLRELLREKKNSGVRAVASTLYSSSGLFKPQSGLCEMKKYCIVSIS